MTCGTAGGIVERMRRSRQNTLHLPLRLCCSVLLAVTVAWSGLPVVQQTLDGGRDRTDLRRVIHTLQTMAGEEGDFAGRFAGLITSLRALAGHKAVLAATGKGDATKIVVVVRCDQIAHHRVLTLPIPPIGRLWTGEHVSIPGGPVSDIPTPPPRAAA